MEEKKPIRGRGTADNPANRFEGVYTDYEVDGESGEKPRPDTRYYPDDTKNILSRNSSPDLSFEYGLNPYRGCEHGCVYCYARPTHEYLGFSAGLDFESRIMVKYDAPEKLRERFSSPRWKPETIMMSGVTDPYQPVERKLELTRRCLGVMAEFLNPVSVITKNHLVTRDLDHLSELAQAGAVHVTLSVTTLDRELGRIMEPRTSSPPRRLEAIRRLTEAGIPAGVNVAPVIPGLTDHELPAILEAAREAGAVRAGYIIVRLPHGVKDLFSEWLEQHMPERKEKVLNRLRDMRDGELNSSEFGKRFRGEGHFAKQVESLFRVHVKRLGYNEHIAPLNVSSFRRKGGTQGDLFR